MVIAMARFISCRPYWGGTELKPRTVLLNPDQVVSVTIPDQENNNVKIVMVGGKEIDLERREYDKIAAEFEAD